MTKRVQGRWWQPAGWIDGTAVLGNSSENTGAGVYIESIQQSYAQAEPPTFIPAPVDLHNHGAGGADVMAGDEAIYTMLACHAAHGCGALLATSVAAPFDELSEFLQSVKRVMASPRPYSSTLLGAHLEGPFINAEKLGAQPPYAVSCDLPQLEAWLETGVVRIITFAPENNPVKEVLDLCQRFNVKVQIGHSLCNWATAKACLESGCGVTHLFNAMSGVNHRCGGIALATLAYGNFAEIIADGFHVDQAAFDLARKSIPNLYSVSDATAASGMPDGHYQLGSVSVEKAHGCVRLPDGTLAGSCLTQLDAIRTLKQWELTWHQIAELVSVRPALWIGEKKFGSIKPGSSAHWLEIQNDSPCALWLNGTRHEF